MQCVPSTSGPGKFDILEQCQQACDEPPPPPPPPPLTTYDCSPEYTCTVNPDGTGWTQEQCDYYCKPPENAKYACVDGQCVEHPEGAFETTEQCAENCGGYDCFDEFGCYLAEEGKGKYNTEEECEADCQGDVFDDGYECVAETGQCVQSPTGTYTSEEQCNEQCSANPDTSRYDCTLGICFASDDGPYTGLQECLDKCPATPPPETYQRCDTDSKQCVSTSIKDEALKNPCPCSTQSSRTATPALTQQLATVTAVGSVALVALIAGIVLASIQ